MPPLQVIFDCDPGKDDAFALFLALACPEALSVMAVTAVEGNVPVAYTTSNARRIVEAAGRPEIPVYRGCARAMLRPLAPSEQVQGAGGLDDSGLPPQARPERPEHAVSALIAMLEAAGEPLTIAAIGPLTNIAMLLIARPDLADRIAHLYVMGGSEGRGNMGEFAEYNILLDPHAAASVFAMNLPATLVTLDHTRDLRPPISWFEAMEGYGAPGRALAAMWRVAPVALYDVAVTGLMLWPDLFETQPCSVAVETCDAVRMGQTRIVRGQGPCRIVTGLDAEAFYSRIVVAMAAYASRPDA
jgi:purine nucleosidase